MTQQMPYNYEIEKSILSQVINEDSITRVRGWLENLSEMDFYSPLSRLVYNSAQDLVNIGKCPQIEAMSEFVNIEDLMDIISSHHTSESMTERIEELKEISLRRKALNKISEYKNKLGKTKNSIVEVEKLIEELDDDLNESRTKDIICTGSVIKKAVVHMTELTNDEKFVRYGLDFMDNNIQHARKQNHVLVASSGSGKTALALSSIAKQMEMGIKSVFFCRESESKELAMRLLSIVTGIPYAFLDEDFHQKVAAFPHMVMKFNEGVKFLQKYQKNFHLYGKGDYIHDAINMRKIVRKHKDENGVDMLWVDYLQNMAAPKSIGTSVYERVSYNSDQIDLITAEFDVATVIMAQLNRGDFNGRPTRANIKGSSDVENVAHWISMLHCQDQNSIQDGYRVTDFYSDKTRLRSGFDIKLGFRGECMSFEKEVVYSSNMQPPSLKPPTI